MYELTVDDPRTFTKVDPSETRSFLGLDSNAEGLTFNLLDKRKMQSFGHIEAWGMYEDQMIQLDMEEESCGNKHIIELKRFALKTSALLLGASLLSLSSGCATDKELALLAAANVEMVKAQAARKEMPTLHVKCGSGADDCKGLDLTFIHPDDRQKISIMRIRGTNDVWAETLPHVFNFGKWAVGAWAATDIMDSITDSSGDSITVNGDNNSTGNSSSVSNVTGDTSSDSSSTIGDTNTSDSNNSTTTTTTDSSDNSDNSNNSDNSDNSNNSDNSDNSNNSDNSDNSNNSDNSDNSVDNTATPTVVDPVIVTP